MGRLRESFRPEFLNRIDEIIIFRQLDETQLRQITSLLLEETTRRLHAQAITIEYTDRGGRLAGPARLPARVRRPPAAQDHPAGGRQPAVVDAARRAAAPRAARDRGHRTATRSRSCVNDRDPAQVPAQSAVAEQSTLT